MELNFPRDPSEYVAAAARFMDLLPQETHPYMRELTQRVIDGKHRGDQSSELGLDLLLSGLEQLRQAESGP